MSVSAIGTWVLLLAVGIGAGGCLGTRQEMLAPIDQQVRQRTGYELAATESIASDGGAIQLFADNLLADGLRQDEAVLLALLQNHDLKARYEELRIAQANVLEAMLPPNPVAEILYLDVEGSGHIWELALVQDIVGLLTIAARKDREEYRYREQQAQLTMHIMDLIRRVKTTYLAVQASQQAYDMLSDILLAVQSSFQMAERMRAAGNITKLELLSRQAIYAEVKLQMAQVELQAILARENLNDLLGLWGERICWKVHQELPAVPDEDRQLLQDVETQAVANSLPLAIYRGRFEAAGADLGLERIQSFLPELALGVEGEREPDGKWIVGPLLEYEVPLFNWGQAKRAKSRARLNRAYQNYTAAAVATRAAARQGRERFITAGDTARYYKAILLPLHEQVMEQWQRQYNAMQIGVFQLLQAKQRQINVQRAYINALQGYWTARAELELLRNGLLIRDSVAKMPGGTDRTGMAEQGH